MNGLKLCYKSISFALAGFVLIGNVFSQQQGDWIEIFTNVGAFEYDDIPPDPYPSSNLFDGDYTTCWVCNPGKIENCHPVFIRLPGHNGVVLKIFPGYGKNQDLYYKNSRPRTIRLSLYAGVHAEGYVTEIAKVYKGLSFPTVQTEELADSFGVQTISLKFPPEKIAAFGHEVYKRFQAEIGHPVVDTAFFLKIEVLDTRKGSKYNDVCISEIAVNHTSSPSSHSVLPPNKIYLNINENALMIDDNKQQGITVYSNPSLVLQLIDVSPDKKWAIVISMPAKVEGRAETTYLLIDLLNRAIANPQLEKRTSNYLSGNEIFFETGKDNQLKLKYRGKDNEYYTVELE